MRWHQGQKSFRLRGPDNHPKRLMDLSSGESRERIGHQADALIHRQEPFHVSMR